MKGNEYFSAVNMGLQTAFQEGYIFTSTFTCSEAGACHISSVALGKLPDLVSTAAK